MDAKAAVFDYANTNEDTSVTIKTTSLSLLGAHPGGLKLTSVSNATHGTVSIRNGKIVFNPDENFSGIAQFDYTVTDGNGLTRTATITVDVAPVADAPVFTVEQPVAQKVGGEFLVNTTSAGGQFQSSIATLANGGYIIAWTDTSYSGGDVDGDSVKAQLFDASGHKVGNEILVNTETLNSQRQPKTAALANGGFVIAWEDNSGLGGDGSGSSIKMQLFDAAGNKAGGEILVNSTIEDSQERAAITALSNGGFVVTWEDNSGLGGDNSEASVKAQIFDAAGNKVGGEILVNGQTAGWQGAPSVTALKDGGFVVAWEDDSGDAGTGEVAAIKLQVFDAAGNKVGGEIRAGTDMAPWQDAASVTALSNGTFVVTWEEGSVVGPDDRDSAIKAQVFSSSGQKIGSEILVNSTIRGFQFAPKITALANGGFVVAWIDESGQGGDSSGQSIKAQVFNASGDKIGGEFLVNTFTGNDQTFPSIAALPNGGFIVSWSDQSGQGGDNSGYSVKAQIFTLANTAENTPLSLNLTAAPTDTDGSETLSLAISTIPVGATLSDGVHTFTATAGNTSVSVTGWNFANLTITPPLNFIGDFKLTFTATVVDKANLTTGLATSTKTVTQTIDVLVSAATGGPVNEILAGGTVAENSADGTVAGTVSGVDPDPNAVLTYSLVNDSEGRFSIDAKTGVITIADRSRLDFEATPNLGITVRVRDQSGVFIDKDFTIRLTDVNEAPTGEALTGGTIAENSANGTVVGKVQGVDPDAGAVLTYTLLDDAGGRFAIDAHTGVITIASGALLDFEAAASHAIKVRVTDQGGLSFDKDFSIAVTNVNEAPTDEILTGGTIAENSPNGTVVGTVQGVDPDAGSTLAYSLIDSAGGRFAIDQNTGVITVANGALLDFETAASHSITVRVTDQGGLTFDKTITIDVTDVLEGATDEVLTGGTVAENSPNGTIVGTVAGVDADPHAVLTYSLVDDANGRFAIDANTGVITVADGPPLDFEAASALGITVRARDQAGSIFDKNFTIHLTDVNEAPADETLSGNTISEGSPNGAVVGTVHGVDPDAGTTLTYSLLDDAGGRFAIDADTGVITVKDGTLLDFETATSHTVSVRVTDQGGLSIDKEFTIQVLNVHEGPTDETLSGGSVAENSPSGTFVAKINGIDHDTGAVLTYLLVDDAGGRFVIDTHTGVVTVANGGLLDFETATHHNITVRVQDQLGSSIDKTFSINVNDVNEVPVAGNGHISATEDSPLAIPASSLAALSPDPEGGPVNVTAVGNAANGTVSLVNGIVTFTPNANFSGIAHFDYTVSDLQGDTSTGTVTVDVAPIADTPVLQASQTIVAKIGSQFRLNTTTGGQFAPSITALANGNFVATWTDTTRRGGDLDDAVRAQIFDSNGNKIGGEFYAATILQGSQNHPRVTALAGGGFVVAWSDESRAAGDSSGTAVRAQVFSANGTPVGAEILANTAAQGDQDDRTIAALANGGFVIAWDDTSGQGGDASGASIKMQVFDANGNKVGGERLVNTSTANSQQFPSAAGLTGGGFVVTWADTSGTGGDPDGSIKGQRFDANGQPVGSEFLVNTQTGSLQTAPFVAGLKNGGFVVAWKDFSGRDGDTSQGSIKAQVFDASGSKVGPEFLVNTSTPNAQQQSVITVLANGDFVIAWTDFSGQGGDNNGAAIKAQLFSATGARIGGEFLVNTFTSGEQKDPSITAFGTDGFIVAWSDASNEGGGVQAQIFTHAGTEENTALALHVAAAVTDTDGSETLALRVSNIPVGATLSDGVHSFTAVAGSTVVDISGWTISALTVTPPLNFVGNFQLTFSATATDQATLSTGIVTDSRTVSQSIEVIVSQSNSTGSIVQPVNPEKVLGGAGDDVLRGGLGNDVLTGGGGNDIYVFGRGGGQDRIVNGLPSNGGPSSELDIAGGVGSEQLWFQRSGNDLSISIIGTKDRITVEDWFGSTASQLQTIRTTDGLKIDASVSQLVQAMASYSSAHPEFDATAVAQVPNDSALQNAIATSWHA